MIVITVGSAFFLKNYILQQTVDTSKEIGLIKVVQKIKLGVKKTQMTFNRYLIDIFSINPLKILKSGRPFIAGAWKIMSKVLEGRGGGGG